jgi:opacity protein-like surface antigen
MWLRFAVVTAATITALPAQTWEVGPMAGYLRLSSKFIGSANTNDPKTDDTSLHSLQPAYGAFITRNTKGYYGFEANFLRSKARMDSKLIPSSSTDRVSESGTVYLNQLSVNGICYFMPKGERFRPFITAGAQVSMFGKPRLKDWPFADSRKVGFNYGGGVKIQLLKNALVRFDVRQIIIGAPYDLQLPTNASGGFSSVGLFKQLQGTMGIGISF